MWLPRQEPPNTAIKFNRPPYLILKNDSFLTQVIINQVYNTDFVSRIKSKSVLYLSSINYLLIRFNLSSPSAMSASLALLNRIKSLETQKKRSNQLSSTAIKVAAAAASSAAISSSQLYGNIPNSSYRTPTHQHYTGYNQTNTLNVSDQQNELGNHSASQSPTSDRRSAKFNRLKF